MRVAGPPARDVVALGGVPRAHSGVVYINGGASDRFEVFARDLVTNITLTRFLLEEYACAGRAAVIVCCCRRWS